jgi:tetratricopeptide (TPR) repeat protein
MLRALLGTTQLDRLIECLTQAAHNARNVDRKAALWRRVGELQERGKGDVVMAIGVVKRALVAKPDDLDSLTQLARLYFLDGQYAEAAELLEKAVKLGRDQLEAHLLLARIYTDHLPKAAKAKKAIERVLADAPEHRDALRMLLKLHLEAGERDKAREVSSKLLEAAGDDDDLRSWALVEIARVELSASSTERAAEALHDAVVIQGTDGEAAKLYRRLAGDHVSWEAFVKTLRAHLDSGRATDPTRATATYLEIARAQNGRLGRPDDAFRTLDEALEKVGYEPTIVLERAEMLAASGRAQEAANAFVELVARAPHVASAWRGLTQVLQQQGRQAEAAVAVSPLLVLGEATDVERNLASERTIRPGAARPGSLGHTTMRLISAGNPEDDERAAALFGAIADGIAKAFPVPYDLYGVRKGDRIKARSGHPVRNEVDRLATVFDLEEVDLYMHAALGGDVALELSSPPALMVPAYVAELPEAQRVFLLARPLAAIASGIYPAYKLTAEDVALVFAGAVRRLIPTFEDGQHDQHALADMQDKLSPSWFSRGKVDEVVQRYYAEPVDARAWAPTAVRTATRAAALLAGDLEACLAAMRYAGLVQGDEPTLKIAKRAPLLDDVLRFWMSDAATEARRLSGLV